MGRRTRIYSPQHISDKILSSQRARSRLGPPEYKWWLGCTTAVLARCISPYLEVSGREFRRDLLPHIESCLSALTALFPLFPETTKQATEMDKFASVYAENGRWMRARGLQLKVIDLRMKILGWRHEDTLRAKRSLGQIYWTFSKSSLASKSNTIS